MTSGVTATGIKGRTYEALFRRQIKRVKPPAVGMAVAYVSLYGFDIVKKILREGGVEEVRLVTDTKDRVTHPKALQSAVDSGWNVRVVDDLTGTFHPKLYVGGAGFGGPAGVANLSLAIMGSPNISRNGFRRNGGVCVLEHRSPRGEFGWPGMARLLAGRCSGHGRDTFRVRAGICAEESISEAAGPCRPWGSRRSSGAGRRCAQERCCTAEERTESHLRSCGLGCVGGLAVLHRRVQSSGRVSEGSGAGTAAHRRGSRTRRGRPDTVRRWGNSPVQISLLRGQRDVSPEHSECGTSCEMGTQAQGWDCPRGVQRGEREAVFRDNSPG